MKTLRICFTRGDDMTQPGGIVLRMKEDRGDGKPEYVVHSFNRERGSLVPTEFYWGAYCNTLDDAMEAFAEKKNRARNYQRGGSVIADDLLGGEIIAERANAPQAA